MYWDQRGATSELLLSNARVTGVQASDLELLQIQQVSRHGSRFPTDNTMREIAELLQGSCHRPELMNLQRTDPFIRFYDICDRYLSEVKHYPNASAELKAYGQSSQMNASLAHLKTQLNLPDSADLSVVDVRAAFAACAFDIMVYGVTNQWCSLMDQTFLNRLDYAEDLEAFYEQGAGYKINYEMAAVLLQVDFILVRIRN
ncbi:hypothetical protein PF003_g13353 [Phytophthora fragariae]|nr:hypothetical protein PF003_g13353 [Phytophthora fragariae]